jgi:uncharacterized protein YkwD
MLDLEPRRWRPFRRGAATVVTLVCIATSSSAFASGEDAPAARPVFRETPTVRTLASNVRSLFPKSDPWRPYLAGEKQCPGGERVDLPLARQEAVLVCLVNWARTLRGLDALRLVAGLGKASSLKAQDVVRCQLFAHSPCGEEWASRVRAAGYAGVVGENLYLASGPWRAPRVAVDSWLNSPPHRANLFARRWTQQGVGAASMTYQGHRGVVVWVIAFAG